MAVFDLNRRFEYIYWNIIKYRKISRGQKYVTSRDLEYKRHCIRNERGSIYTQIENQLLLWI